MPLSDISLTSLYLALAGYAVSLAFFLFRNTDWTDIIFSVAFIAHTISQLSRGWFIGMFIPHAIVEGVFFLPWCLAAFIAVSRLLHREPFLTYSVLFPLIFFMTFALFYQKGVFPPSPLSRTIFSPLFFLFEVSAHACFILGAWFAFRFLRKKEDGHIFHSFIVWGFILYSTAQVVGAIWCYQGWATLFNWSERHLQSASLWCYYAAYLHARFLPSVDSRMKAWLSLAGIFFLVLFSYGGHLKEINMPRLGG